MPSETVALGKRQRHDLKRVTRRLATGEVRVYTYYRPTMRRIESEPGTPEYDFELSEARRGRTRKSDGVSYLYFVESAALEAVKIGTAADPYRRLQILQVGSPDTLRLLGWIKFPAGEPMERNIHGLFKKSRLRGEWFKATPDLLEFIRKRCSL